MEKGRQIFTKGIDFYPFFPSKFKREFSNAYNFQICAARFSPQKKLLGASFLGIFDKFLGEIAIR